MKKSSNRPAFRTVFLFLTVLLFAAFDAPAQFNAAGLTAKTNASHSRERIIKTSPVSTNNLPAILDLEKAAFALLNEQRAKKNLGALRWSDEIAKIARVHSENMAKHKFFNHRGIDGLMVDQRADALGVSKWQAIGENIAFNQGYENPVEFAVERWMLSPSHRENILNVRWQESAVGAAIGDDGSYYFTQVFLLRK